MSSSVHYESHRMASDKQDEGIERMLRAITRQEIELFYQYKPELEKKLRSGLLRYAVEWWENDCLEIDENAHMLFLFRDDTEYDIVLNRQIHDRLASLLALAGISWEYRFRPEFSSNILYPAEFAGQPYYEKAPQPPKKWWERVFDALTFNLDERWIRRKDLP